MLQYLSLDVLALMALLSWLLLSTCSWTCQRRRRRVKDKKE